MVLCVRGMNVIGDKSSQSPLLVTFKEKFYICSLFLEYYDKAYLYGLLVKNNHDLLLFLTFASVHYKDRSMTSPDRLGGDSSFPAADSDSSSPGSSLSLLVLFFVSGPLKIEDTEAVAGVDFALGFDLEAAPFEVADLDCEGTDFEPND